MAVMAVVLATAVVATPVQAEQVETGDVDVNFSGLLGALRAKLIGVVEEPEPEISDVEAEAEPALAEEDIPVVTAESETPAPSNLVEEVQILLADLGYAPGKPDGIAGPATTRALEQFQRNQGLPVDGEMSVELLTQLQEIRAAADARDQQGSEPIAVASGPAADEESQKTPLLDTETTELPTAKVDRFEIIGVSLGDSLGSVRRLRPFEQKGELDETSPLVTAFFGGSDGEVLRKLEVRFGAENETIWVQLEQGNFPIDAIPGIVANLCERYGETAGCTSDLATLQCDSAACRKGLHLHEMQWVGENGKVLEAAFFTGGSSSVTQVVLTLKDNEAVQRIEQIARELQSRPGASAFKL